MRDEDGEEGGIDLMENLGSHIKESGFYPKSSKKPLKVLKWIRLNFLKVTLPAERRVDWRGVQTGCWETS